MLARATSAKGYHYFGSGRFFILAGKTFADTMLELLAAKTEKQGGSTFPHQAR